MAVEVQVEPITAGQLDALLPLIATYQRFYAAAAVDEEPEPIPPPDCRPVLPASFEPPQ